jgi:hypothetical protein
VGDIPSLKEFEILAVRDDIVQSAALFTISQYILQQFEGIKKVQVQEPGC